jgi:hypothetical protein
MDAMLVRDILNRLNEPILTIHDCFLVDILSISNFIDIINQENNKKIFREMR